MSKIPTIAMIPSGYKANKLYSVLPTNGDADLATTRASTATRVNELGLIEDVATGVPRLDYSDGGCPSLLLEPASTNLAEYSEDFSNAVWTVFDATKAPNSIISSDGTLNGCRVTGLAGTNKVIQQIVNVTADPSNDRTYTGSLYIKSPNITSCQIRVGSAGSNTTITISDEWQRFDAQYVLGATFTAIRLGVVLFNEGDIVDIAFGQVEEQSYATSYIRNLTTGTTTRVSETVSKTGLSSYINSSEGVFYVESKALSDDNTNRWLSITDGTANNSIELRYTSTSNQIRCKYTASTIVEGDVSFTVADTTVFNKIAFLYSNNNFALYVNGVKVVEDLVGSTSSFVLDRLFFSLNGTASTEFISKVKDLRVYNEALTDAELIALTS